MSVDPTAPLPEPVPETRAHPPIDPWAAEPPTAPLPTTAPPAHLPPTTPFPVTPAQPAGAWGPAQPAGAWPAVGPYPPTPMAVPPALTGYASGPEVVAVQIAEIAVSPPFIRTPAGVLPLAGATWHVADYWQREEKVATWALVCAIVGFFCLFVLSLLFLLVKETRHHGTVQVTVTNGAQQYVARIPVSDQGQVQHLNNQVNYARSLSSR
ncbi:hypothetical protein HNR22_002671 [Micromonospora jinlongensis]|uniref:Uncharacterized protein n=1 Tax=Micromonospora jinlongensis TaxID=1287877 RepID=A0A7Z0BFD5_9ACTN|nr:hypothetical protein [Micromonospora jinlongensis]NYH42944.1 hypothetical protein [Micromonospora jinlongensis]